MAELTEQFQDFLKHCCLYPGMKVLLAVSGGVDSMVMFELFNRIRRQWNLKIGVVHVHHRLRGGEADRDEAFVRAAARSRGMLYYCSKQDVRGLKEREGLSTEEAARRVRYRILSEIKERIRFDRIALAHNANDQAETILMHMFRGSGLRGLGGMSIRRGDFIRPLLFAERDRIASFAGEQHIAFREDSSNRSPAFERNRVRKLLAASEEAAGKRIIGSICRTGRIHQEIEQDMERFAAQAFHKSLKSRNNREIVLDINEILTYFKSIQKQLFIHILKHCFGRPMTTYNEIVRIQALCARSSSGRLQLRDDIAVILSQKTLTFRKGNHLDWCVDVYPDKRYALHESGIIFESRKIKGKPGTLPENALSEECVDFHKLSLPMQLRPARPGEWFIPFGMKGKKKIYDFYRDMKIPLPERSVVPVLVSGDDVVWITGYRLDNRFKITGNTTDTLYMKIQKIS